jgi:predicted transcriptional regulator
MKNFRKKLPRKKIFSEYVKVMNGIFGLSKREAEIYSFILKLDTEWTPASELDYKDILSTTNRRLIIRECNINKTNLSRLIIQLRNNGLVEYNQHGGYEIPSSIAVDLKDKLIEVVFSLELSDD